MQAFATEVITRAALAAGLPEGRVIDMVKKDNLTIKRPRIELQFMPETLTRTGRTLNVCRQSTDQIRKRELYEVELTVNANILADDRAWLERFSYDFVAALSSGATTAGATGYGYGPARPPLDALRTSAWAKKSLPCSPG